MYLTKLGKAKMDKGLITSDNKLIMRGNSRTACGKSLIACGNMVMTILLLVLPFTPAGRATAQDLLKIEQFRLHNGMTVWVNEDHTQPKVFGAVVVRAGAKDCPNTGIAHYLEHLLFKGTQQIGTTGFDKERPWLDSITAQYDLLAQTQDKDQRLAIQRHINMLSIKAADYAIPNEFSNLISLYGGTRLNAYTSFDETVFHNYFSPQYLAQWCQLNADRLRNPVFRLFQGELETVYEEKNMYADDMLMSAAEQVQRYAFAGTPYAYPIIGATDSLKNPRLSEMYRFFKQYYVPENMGLILCGDLRALDKDLLERTFGQFPASNHPIVKTPRSHLRDMRQAEALRVKVPIPIIGLSGYFWQAPSERDSDYVAFQVMAPMLCNDSKTGLIDSLATSGQLFFNYGADRGYDLKDFSLYGFALVPRMPFGSRKKAERLCLQQVQKLKRGDFSDQQLETEKLSIMRNQMLNLETISGRSTAMINAFSHELDWQDIVNRYQAVSHVTKADIMRVARRWLGDDSLKIVKKFGRYPKEHVSQPDYKPVTPKNAGQQSAYAKAMAAEPIASVEPKDIDFDHDATHEALSPLVSLYTKKNPLNTVFTLRLIYRIGTRNDPRLDALADYLDLIGTQQHTRHAFAQLLRQHGATISAEASPSSFTITIQGLESHISDVLPLLHEWLTSPKADHKQLAKLVKAAKVGKYAIFEDNAEIADAVYEYAERGQESAYLKGLSASDMKRLNDDALLQLFQDVQTRQLDIVYCGTRDDIAARISSYVPIAKVQRPWEQVKTHLRDYDETTVYLFNNPSARQTIVGAYVPIAPQTTTDDRARLTLWGNYFGGGMQSVLFQDIREFRSLAYYAYGQSLATDLKTQSEERCGYQARIGTQADKTMQTLLLMDSLFDAMPVRAHNLEATKQLIVNSINNSFPTFRDLPVYIADKRLLGYDHDPNRDLLTSLKGMSLQDAVRFYDTNIKSRPRAIIIVGNKKQLDMDRLRKMGKVVELKKTDIVRR